LNVKNVCIGGLGVYYAKEEQRSDCQSNGSHDLI
jgi:hypothetical protein